MSCVVAGVLLPAGLASAQLGALVSPGPLAKPHASLEGLANCAKCHEQGRRVTAQKCLACHAPVAERMARKIGVHRAVTTDCVTCHAEHAGVDGQLRPFDLRKFNHAVDTAFPLDGKHAVVTDCAKCHTTRSFLTAKAACATCHTDVHKGTLGANCVTCHAVSAPFKTVTGRFDHSKAAFPLAGAHATVTCASCHRNQTYKGVAFAACTDCHRDPHQKSLGATCTNCHTNESWRTRTINHTRTAFPLVGKHEAVSCVACHAQPAMKVKVASATCGACHADVHRGTFKQDCKSCHTESGWTKAPFDHKTTKFALTDKHEGLACAKCHTPVPAPAARTAPAAKIADFRGLKTTCVSCHADVHDQELGMSCESCHNAATFKVPRYAHQQTSTFFQGQHAPVACEGCHQRTPLLAPVRSAAPLPLNVKFKSATETCVTCHVDVHLGQEGAACETCHGVAAAKFAISGFAHTTRTKYPLAGRHASIECVACHKRETGVFPSSSGTAVRYKGVGTECRACHADIHQGQLGTQCDTCHRETTFKVPGYKHRNRSNASFFTGKHVSQTCEGCHKPATGRFGAASGTAVQYAIDTKCVSCHTDKHRGALGPDCARCHKP